MSSIRNTKTGGVLVGPEDGGYRGEIYVPMYSLTEEAIKREYLEVTNAWIDITSVNAQGEEFAVVEAHEQYAKKLLKNGKRKIRWVVCTPTEHYKCLEYGHTSVTFKGPDGRPACRRCSLVGHEAKTCNGASGGSVAHTASSSRSVKSLGRN